MFVKNAMIPKHKVHSLTKGTSVGEALAFLEEKKIDGAPILDGSKYLGIVTKWSIYEAGFSSTLQNNEFLSAKKVEDIAIKKNHVIDEKAVFEETLLEVKDIPFIAAVDNKGDFIGIVTRFDVLEQFQSAFGMNKKGIRISFSSIESEGRIARLASITSQFHQNIISLTTFDETDKLVRRIVMRIEPSSNFDKYLDRLEKNGFQILDIKKFD
jgi:CBS domain-containing protein